MANDTAVRGFFPFNTPDNPPKLAFFKANTAQAIYRGMPVMLNNSGQVQICAASTGGANTAILGIAWEFLDSTLSGLPVGMTFLPNSVGGTNYGPFLPASQDGYVGVIYDPLQLYVIEEGTGGSAFTASSAGMVGYWTYQASTGNNYTGYANITIDRANGLSTGTAGTIQLLFTPNQINNDATINAAGDYAKWVVRINRHALTPFVQGALGILT